MNTLRNLAAIALATTFLLPAQEKNTAAPAGTAADAAMKQAPASGMRIGVVDLVKAIELYPKWIKLQGELDAMGKGFKAQVERQAADLSKLKTQIEMYDPESQDRRQAEGAYEIKMQEARMIQKLMAQQGDAEYSRALLSVYEDLEIAIPKVAKMRDVSIVLRVHRMGAAPGDAAKLPEKTVAGRLQAFERREVLFAGMEVDITDDLIKLLQVPLEDAKDPAKDPAKDGKDGKDPKAETPNAPDKGAGKK